jgi:outer membrane receptor protein involved in Fe transport
VKQTIIWDTNITSTVTDPSTPPSLIDKNYILPTATVKYNLNEKEALRFAVSKTYTMPQFKEMANFLYVDVNFNDRGNPYLRPSTVYNADVKYDFYLSKNEIISVGGYYKYIQDPILRIIMNTPDLIIPINTRYAYVAGGEIEVRKTLYKVEGEKRNSDFNFGLNASYLYKEERSKLARRNHRSCISIVYTPQRKMQGAAPWLVNSDLSFKTKPKTAHYYLPLYLTISTTKCTL